MGDGNDPHERGADPHVRRAASDPAGGYRTHDARVRQTLASHGCRTRAGSRHRTNHSISRSLIALLMGRGRALPLLWVMVLQTPSRMDVTEIKSGGTVVITPTGRLDAASAHAFQERLLSGIDGGETSVLLDLVRLDYISSVGLRALLTAAKRVQARDGRFAVCALTDNVREVFQVSGFDTIIEVHPDRATALHSFA